MAKIVSVVGGRPQFIKEAITGQAIRKYHEEILVHTGQHYDVEMSGSFFEQLGLIEPKYNLGVGSQSHAKQTAAVMIGVESVLANERPDVVLVYGDMNSTMGAAIASAKMNIPVAHVEAGARSHIFDMPEEQNRIVADHLSKWNYALNEECYHNLLAEGLRETAINTGDVMYDAFLYYQKECSKVSRGEYWRKLHFIDNYRENEPKEWYFATIHRPENTDDTSVYESILDGLNELPCTVIMPVHPRNNTTLEVLKKRKKFNNIVFVKPIGYLESLYYMSNANGVVTDSGGLQREAYWAKVPCTVVLRGLDDKRMADGNCLVLARPEKTDILSKVIDTVRNRNSYDYSSYGDGKACEKIARSLMG